MHTLFECPRNIYTKVDDILGYKTPSNELKRIEIIQNVFSDIQNLSKNKKQEKFQTFGNQIILFQITHGWKRKS